MADKKENKRIYLFSDVYNKENAKDNVMCCDEPLKDDRSVHCSDVTSGLTKRVVG